MNNSIIQSDVSDVSVNTVKVIDKMVIVYNPDGTIDKELSRKFPRKNMCHTYLSFLTDDCKMKLLTNKN